MSAENPEGFKVEKKHTGIVIVEERVQACAVDEDIARIDDVETPFYSTIATFARTGNLKNLGRGWN